MRLVGELGNEAGELRAAARGIQSVLEILAIIFAGRTVVEGSAAGIRACRKRKEKR